jgi:Ca-activated chloride channel homolog
MNHNRSSAHKVFAVVFAAAMALAAALGQGNPEPERPKITLAVAVTDKDHQAITGLKAEDFVLYEDDQPQQILSVTGSTVSACIGLLLDSSGSMRHKRDAMVHALTSLVHSGNSNDRFFVVNFNNQAYLDQDFTSDPAKIEKAMTRMNPRGGTALYDAISGSADHLSKAAQCEKRVLVVTTDGDDNSSQELLEETLNGLQYATSPVIYVIGMPNEQMPSHTPTDRRALELLTAATGGALFFADSNKDLDKAAMKVATEIQNQYVITYVPTAQQGYRKIKLEVRTPEYKDVVIRVKPGYRPGDYQARH